MHDRASASVSLGEIMNVGTVPVVFTAGDAASDEHAQRVTLTHTRVCRPQRETAGNDAVEPRVMARLWPLSGP